LKNRVNSLDFGEGRKTRGKKEMLLSIGGKAKEEASGGRERSSSKASR